MHVERSGPICRAATGRAQRRVSAAETARDILIGGGEGGGILLCTIKMALVRRSVIPAVMRQLFFVVLEVCILGSTSVSRPSQSSDMKFDFFYYFFYFFGEKNPSRIN